MEYSNLDSIAPLAIVILAVSILLSRAKVAEAILATMAMGLLIRQTEFVSMIQQASTTQQALLGAALICPTLFILLVTRGHVRGRLIVHILPAISLAILLFAEAVLLGVVSSASSFLAAWAVELNDFIYGACFIIALLEIVTYSHSQHKKSKK